MKRIAVIGSFATDLMARTPHLPVPGETVLGSFFKIGPGGKGFNQAIAAWRAGGKPVLSTMLGKDLFAPLCLDMMKAEGMDMDYVFTHECAGTAAALISVDENTSQNEIVIVPGALDKFGDEEIEKVMPLIENTDYLLVQLEMNIEATEKIIRIAYEKGVKVILNPAPVSKIKDETYGYIWCVTPNEVEAQILSDIHSLDDRKAIATYFIDRRVENVILTLGKEGAYLYDGKEEYCFGNYDVDVLDTTGAGDAFNGGLLAALAKEYSLKDSCTYANIVSNLAVTRMGTSVAMPYENEIDEFIRKNGIKL